MGLDLESSIVLCGCGAWWWNSEICLHQTIGLLELLDTKSTWIVDGWLPQPGWWASAAGIILESLFPYTPDTLSFQRTKVWAFFIQHFCFGDSWRWGTWFWKEATPPFLWWRLAWGWTLGPTGSTKRVLRLARIVALMSQPGKGYAWTIVPQLQPWTLPAIRLRTWNSILSWQNLFWLRFLRRTRN